MTREEQIHRCRVSEPTVGAVYCRTCLRYKQPEDFCDYASPRTKHITGKARKSKRSTKDTFITEGDVHEKWRSNV